MLWQEEKEPEESQNKLSSLCKNKCADFTAANKTPFCFQHFSLNFQFPLQKDLVLGCDKMYCRVESANKNEIANRGIIMYSRGGP